MQGYFSGQLAWLGYSVNECFAAMINNNGAPEVFRLLHTSLTLTLRAAFAHKSDKKAMNSQSSGGF